MDYCPNGLRSRSCFYCPDLITVARSVTRDKRFVKVTWLWGNDVTTSWVGVPNRMLWMRFNCCPNLVFLASPWLELYRSSNWSFCWLRAVQNCYFCWLWVSQRWLYSFLFTVWAGHSYFTELRQDVSHFQCYFQWFNQRVQSVGINKWISKVQSFISFCNKFF